MCAFSLAGWKPCAAAFAEHRRIKSNLIKQAV
jgi:hypothetical protein